ncbi:MBL fold metallo-hydrolase [Candidatus Bathyarchaeota archaeon]|nr:MBL fold metallo-hydrolase [Candidatus Bathyarchaeota archaeon]
MVEVLKGVYSIDHSDAGNHSMESWVLNCNEGVIIVDTAMRDTAIEKIETEIKSFGKSWKDVRLILITHKHGDHTRNIPKLVELTGAPVKAHELEAPLIEKAVGTHIDGLPDHTILPYCGEIEVIHIPGHSEGNASYYLKKHKAIIAGDTIFGDENCNLTTPPERYCLDAKMAAKEIIRLLKYDFDSLLYTHGKDIMKDAKIRIKELLEKSN